MDCHFYYDHIQRMASPCIVHQSGSVKAISKFLNVADTAYLEVTQCLRGDVAGYGNGSLQNHVYRIRRNGVCRCPLPSYNLKQ